MAHFYPKPLVLHDNFAVFENLFKFFNTAYDIFYYICRKLWCALKKAHSVTVE